MIRINSIMLILLLLSCSDSGPIKKDNSTYCFIGKSFDNKDTLVLDGESIKHFTGKLEVWDSSRKNIISSGDLENGRKSGAWVFYSGNNKPDSVLQYFDDRKIFSLDKELFEFDSYSFADSSINISLPKSWIIKSEHSETSLVFTCSKNCINEQFCPNISCSLNDYLSIEEQIEHDINLLSKQLDEFKLITEGDVYVNDRPSYQVTYTFTANKMKLACMTSWYPLFNGENVVLSAMCLNSEKNSFLKHKGMFHLVMESIKFNE